jgi:hypothetical protein
LNATQAYDKSTSQIVLASYPATSTINTPTNSLGVSGSYPPSKVYGDVGVTGAEYPGLELIVSTVKAGSAASAALKTINMDLFANALSAAAAKQTLIVPTTAQFVGTIVRAGVFNTGEPIGSKSNANKEIFAGNITVGTGLYKTWQGKYAVLKVDLLTDKAILRVYNE